MYFTVGVEYSKNEGEAYGLVIPALSNEDFDCFSASDTKEGIANAV